MPFIKKTHAGVGEMEAGSVFGANFQLLGRNHVK
jgi:hypothetical protein